MRLLVAVLELEPELDLLVLDALRVVIVLWMRDFAQRHLRVLPRAVRD